MRLSTTESFLSPQDIPPMRIVTADIEDAGTTPTKKANLSTPLPNPESTIVTFRIPELKFGPNLLRYSVNLNKLAEEGKLDEVVGRDKEIMMAMQVLSRRRKNNPCLVGEAGVGMECDETRYVGSFTTVAQVRLPLQRASRCSYSARSPPHHCWIKL